MRNMHCRRCNTASNIEKVEMRNAHWRTWNMAKKVKIMENEKHTLSDVKYVKDH